MQRDTGFGSSLEIQPLGDECRDHAGQYIAHAGSGHARISLAADRGRALPAAFHERARAFENNNTAELLTKELGLATSEEGTREAGLDAIGAVLAVHATTDADNPLPSWATPSGRVAGSGRPRGRVNVIGRRRVMMRR